MPHVELVVEQAARRRPRRASPSGVNGVTSAVKAPRRVGVVVRSSRWICVGLGRSVSSVVVRSCRCQIRSGSASRRSVMPVAVGVRQQGVRGEQGSGHVGGAVPCRDAQLDGFTRGVEADDVHPRGGAGAEGDHLQHVRDPARPTPRPGAPGASSPRCGRIRSAMASAVPDGRSGLVRRCCSNDVRVVLGEAAEEARGLLGELREQDDAER